MPTHLLESDLVPINNKFEEIKTTVINPMQYGAKGDGYTNETSFFDALESVVTGKKVDLGGRVYKVDSIPNKNRYEFGYFKVGNILYPANNTLQAKTQKILSTGKYASWAQDKAHVYKGTIYAPFLLAEGHKVNKNTYTAKSSDGGDEWYVELSLGDFLTDYKAHRHAWSAGVLPGGRQVMSAQSPVSATDHGILDYYLYTRRLPEFAIKSNCISTEAESNVVTIYYPDHGCKSGDVVKITSTDGAASTGGISISGEYNLNRINKDYFYILGATNATTTVTNGGGADIYFDFKEMPFEEVTFNGQSIGKYLSTLDPVNAMPAMLHSFAQDGPDSFLCFYSGSTDRLIRIKDIYNIPTIELLFTAQFPSVYAEGSVKRVDSNRLCGFLRTQSADWNIRFWSSTDNGVTATEFEAPFLFGYKCNVALEVVGDMIYGFVTERSWDYDPSKKFESLDVPAYLLRANVDDAFVNGWNAFDIIQVGRVHFSNHAGEASGAGVPSMVHYGNKLMVFYGSEETRAQRDEAYNATRMEAPGSPDMYCTTFFLNGNQLETANPTQAVIDKENSKIGNANSMLQVELGGGDGSNLTVLSSKRDKSFDIAGDGTLITHKTARPITHNTNDLGIPSQRFKKVYSVGAEFDSVTIRAFNSTIAPNQSLFVDSADGKIKFKDANGVVNPLY